MSVNACRYVCRRSRPIQVMAALELEQELQAAASHTYFTWEKLKKKRKEMAVRDADALHAAAVLERVQ